MEHIVPVCLGIGLAAACGFRVFVPLLGASVAAMSGYLELSPEMHWMGEWPALICFLVATILEVAAYYVPWIDNALDTIATPAAVVAGTLVTASMIQEMTPLMKWSLALIAGGGVAALVQSATVALRGTSSATTAGTGNFLVATLELIGAVVGTVLSLIAPIVAALLVALLVGIALRILFSRRRFIKPAIGQ